MKKKKISKIYKKLIRKIFKLIYGEIYYFKNIRFSKRVKTRYINDKKIKKYNKKKYKIFIIDEGRISTDYVENVSIIDKNRIVEGPSYQQIKGKLVSAKLNSSIKNGTPYLIKRVKGRVFSLTQGASGHSNYFHWLFDILPKIVLFKKIFKKKDIDYFYTSELLNYQKKILKLLNLDKIKILNSKKYRHVTSDQIVATEHPWYEKGYILEEVGKMPDWIIKWIRFEFLKFKQKFKANKKIFIDRSESKFNHCQIQNNSEVIKFLEKKGFTSYKVGKLSFVNQIFLFNNADVIIGAHGAAFANLVFCKKNTKVIEIKPKNNPNFINKTISRINKLDYFLLKTEKIKKKYISNGDIFVDLNKLNKIISK